MTLLLVSCGGGGGDSSTTTLRCGNTNCQTLNPAVSTTFVQGANNLRVSVDDLGPHGFGSSISTNVLFATVTVCALGGTPGTNQCASIDHVLVDTGSVGLRVLASKVQGLSLPSVPVGAGQNAWECFPFVIGGLWGANAVADVWLGQQRGTAVPMQLIDDRSAMNPTADCISVTDNSLLTSAASLGANGILGIGSTTLDCGADCVSGSYHVNSSSPPGSSVLYYACPPGATNSSTCSLTPIQANSQTFNPVAALSAPYNNGVILKMPAIPTTQTGAATAAGELIFGVGDPSALTSDFTQVMLGTNPATDSYLSINTRFNGHTFASSYLDTGTNGMFFYDASITVCASSSSSSYWYCPASTMSNLQALLSDGDNITQNVVPVSFQIANFTVLSNTSNTAFADAAGAVGTTNSSGVAVPDTKTFAWGMPFFYGRQVYLSIWQQPGSLSGPWYAWAPL